jgi:hypothetical protein
VRDVEVTEPMNGYGLTAVIIQSIASLAWPFAFVVAVWLFREKLAELLPKFYVKHKDWEASFRLDKAEAEAAALPPGPAARPEALPTPEENTRFEEMVRLSPQAAILELRADLEVALRMAAVAQNLETSSSPLGMLAATRALRNKGLIDAHTSAILDDLRNVGNAAAHGAKDISAEDARRFKKLSDDVKARLNILL